MTLQHVRGVEVTFAAPPAPAASRTDDVIVVLGPYETAAGSVVQAGPFRNLSSATPTVGTDGLVYDALTQIFSAGSSPAVYTVGTTTAAGDTVPTTAEMTAALAVIEDPGVNLLYAPGATAGGAAGGASGALTASATLTAMKAKAAELGAVIIADPPYGAAITNANRVTWGTANLGTRTWGFAPSTAADRPLGGYFIGTWDAGVAANGRGLAGSPHGRVITGLTPAGLSERISRNPRVVSGTAEAALINAGMAVAAVRADGAVVISMTDAHGVDDLTRFWTVQLAVDHLVDVLTETLDENRNHGPLQGRVEWLSDQLQLASRPLVADNELGDVVVVPDTEFNTPSTLAAGNPRFVVTVQAPIPLIAPSLRISVGGVRNA